MEYPRDEKGFIKEFVRRSRQILFSEEKTEYETTALINCALGMFIIPRERRFPVGGISLKLFQAINEPSLNTYEDIYDSRQLMRHLRNSLAHGNFELIAEREVLWGIIVKDRNPKKKEQVFEVSIPIDQFREIIIEYADSIING